MIKDILVHVEDGDETKARVNFAIAMAQSADAHLAGVYMNCEMSMPAFAYGPVSGEVITTLKRQGDEAAQRARKTYDTLCDAAGVPVDYREDTISEAQAAARLALHARYADLIVVGQTNPDEAGRIGGSDLPELVLMSAGRPVLVVPYIGVRNAAIKTVVVGWDGSREAARAVNDSMPLLQQADTVIVLSANTEHGDRGILPGVDIAHHLARHGVKAEVQRSNAEDMEPAELLLSRIADVGADMLVMGGYGHSRVREMILGGVSRTILREMTVPVFMSH